MDSPIGSALRRFVFAAGILLCAAGACAQVVVGQDGKDVVYLPTTPELVEKMLDLAGVTPQDYVIDLGSGDGRIVIGAARRGARALGIEYDGPLVELSRQNAAASGVGDKATFVQADLFQSDFSQATLVTTFLLSDIMQKLQPKILGLKPGSRLVSNSFTMEGWAPDETATLKGCTTWCTAYLWIVPARVEGTWRLQEGELTLKQDVQMLSGTLAAGGRSTAIENGRLRGDRITFSAAGAEYAGRVSDGAMQGTVARDGRSEGWSATKREKGKGKRE